MTRTARKALSMISAIGAASAISWSSRASAQSAPTDVSRKSGIAGVIRDSIGRPIQRANVLVDGEKLTTVSDDSGHFDLRGLPSGPNGFTIAKIGYAPVSFETSLPPDSIVVLAIQMRSVQTLSTVNVTAERVQASLARIGFVERQRLGLGSFLTPQQVDSMADLISTPSQFLRGVRGIDLRCRNLGCVPVARHAGCLWLFIDGVPNGPARLIDSAGLNPNAISAIEVYDRAGTVPMEFQGALPEKQGRGFSMSGGCGAIAFWTKTRVPR